MSGPADRERMPLRESRRLREVYTRMTASPVAADPPAAKHRRRPPLLVGLAMIAIASGRYLGWQYFAHSPNAAKQEPTPPLPVIATTVPRNNIPIVRTGIVNLA